MKLRIAVRWVLRLLLAGCFVYAGGLKAIHPGQLQITIERYHLVSSWTAWAAAAYLPYLEIFAALALFHPKTAAAGRVVLGTLLLVFVAALVSAWARGLNVVCGCFGGAAAEEPRYLWWISRDLLLLGAIAWLHRIEGAANANAAKR